MGTHPVHAAFLLPDWIISRAGQSDCAQGTRFFDSLPIL